MKRTVKGMSCISRLMAAFSLVTLVSAPVQAQQWFSTYTPSSVRGEEGAVLDVTVSMDFGPGASYPKTIDQRKPYEDIFGNFAEAVFEQTNGAHRIGKVRVYSRGRFNDRADILWGRSEWPRSQQAGRQSGFSVGPWVFNKGHIYMGDVFPFATPYNALASANRRGAGYTLAHEWAQYAYGLYDEYADPAGDPWGPDGEARPDDTPPAPSIMANHWKAANTGDLNWLNHSNPIAYTNGWRTAQYRMFNADCWTTLSRPTEEDPRVGLLWRRAPRFYYPEMSLAAPEQTAAPRLEINTLAGTSAARLNFKVIWMDDEADYVLVIDNSGSMATAEKMESARQAARTFVDLTEDEITSVAIVTFSDTAVERVGLTPINSDADRDVLKAIIDDIEPEASTNMHDGVKLGLDILSDTESDDTNRIVFLLSDGMWNVGGDPADYIPAYQEAQIPIFTFAFGNDADQDVLEQLATETGGNAYFSPTTVADLLQVFLDANTSSSSRQLLASWKGTLKFLEFFADEFIVDSTLNRIDINVVLAAEEGGSLVVSSPSGVPYPISTELSSNGDVVGSLRIDEPELGEWKVVGTSDGPPVDYRLDVSAIPFDSATYSLTLGTGTGDLTIHYPEPAILVLSAKKSLPINNLIVKGSLTTPESTTYSITFRDDGNAPDAKADDGYYSATMPYDIDGTYKIEVYAEGDEQDSLYSDRSTFPIQDPTGSRPRESVFPVGEAFGRIARLQVRVEGSIPDDFADTIDDETLPRGFVVPTNEEVSGRLESGGDRDIFVVPSLPASQQAYARISGVSSAADFTLKALSSTGEMIAETTMAVNGDKYPRILLPKGLAAAFLLEVSAVTSGTSYNVSVGEMSEAEAGGRVVEFNFGTESEDWSFTTAPGYIPSDGAYEEGSHALTVTPGDNTNSFAFWESPLVFREGLIDWNQRAIRGGSTDEYLYRVTAHVSTDAPATQAPTLRIRTSSQTFDLADIIVSTSIGDAGFSPSPGGITYEHFFTYQENVPASRLDFDVLNFDKSDVYGPTVNFGKTYIESLGHDPLRTPRIDGGYNFRSSAQGWTLRTVEGFTPPTGTSTSQGLALTSAFGTPSRPVFGYFGSDEAKPLFHFEAGRLYRFKATLGSNATFTSKQYFPTIRLRVNTDSYVASAYRNIESESAVAILPSIDGDKTYSWYLKATEAFDGDAALLSFDYLISPESGNRGGTTVYLRDLTVMSYDMPE